MTTTVAEILRVPCCVWEPDEQGVLVQCPRPRRFNAMCVTHAAQDDRADHFHEHMAERRAEAAEDLSDRDLDQLAGRAEDRETRWREGA